MAKPVSGGGGNGGGAGKSPPKTNNTTATVDENGLLTVQIIATDPDKNDYARYSFSNNRLIYEAPDGVGWDARCHRPASDALSQVR